MIVFQNRTISFALICLYFFMIDLDLWFPIYLFETVIVFNFAYSLHCSNCLSWHRSSWLDWHCSFGKWLSHAGRIGTFISIRNSLLCWLAVIIALWQDWWAHSWPLSWCKTFRCFGAIWLLQITSTYNSSWVWFEFLSLSILHVGISSTFWNGLFRLNSERHELFRTLLWHFSTNYSIYCYIWINS